MPSIYPEPRSASPRILCIVLLSSVMSFMGCKSDDEANITDTSIVGQWILVEMLTDPGDGSGEFMRVDSSRTITFAEDGTYASNADVCSFSTTDGNPTSGNFTENENGYTVECDSPFSSPLSISVDNGDLIVAFFCFEPCLQKFRRVD